MDRTAVTSNRGWWPNQLNLASLHRNSSLSDPMAKGFKYSDEFRKLDLEALKQDLLEVMTPVRAGEGARDARADPVGLQPRAGRREAGLARRPDRHGRVRGGRTGRQECWAERRGAVRARAHGCLAGADRRRVVRRARTSRRRFPQLCGGRPDRAGGSAAGRSGPAPDADRARDDGARGRHASPGRERRRDAARRVHRSSRDAHQRSGRRPRKPRTCSRVATMGRASSSGPAPAWT